MKIIGIAGLKGSGKDTLASYVAYQVQMHKQYSYRPFFVAFADALKRMLLPLGYPVKVLWGPSEAREWVHPVLGISARTLLQKVGTEVARQVDPDFWVKAWVDVVDKLATGDYSYTPEQGIERLLLNSPNEVFVLAADLRFDNEHKELAKRRAYTVLVERDVAQPKVDTHVSESWCREAARRCVSTVVTNNGTLDDLKVQAAGVFGSVTGA